MGTSFVVSILSAYIVIDTGFGVSSLSPNAVVGVSVPVYSVYLAVPAILIAIYYIASVNSGAKKSISPPFPNQDNSPFFHGLPLGLS